MHFAMCEFYLVLISHSAKITEIKALPDFAYLTRINIYKLNIPKYGEQGILVLHV